MNIQTVKSHLFDDLHLLDRHLSEGEPALLRRFDADPLIASAWLKLSNGSALPSALQLMRHEMAEVWFMRRHGRSYDAAHGAAQRRCPWHPEEQMRITQIGHRLMASHTSGPTHNFLEFRMSDEPVRDKPAMTLDEPCEGWPLDSVREAILAGIEQGGGTRQVKSIRVTGADTPTVDIYRYLARKLIEHVQEQRRAGASALLEPGSVSPFLGFEVVRGHDPLEPVLPIKNDAASVKRKVRS